MEKYAMNNQTLKSFLYGFTFAAMSSTAYAVEQKNDCNSTDTLQGWGIWCGIDTFLTQQEPTAAGPIDASAGPLAGTNFDSDDFGGKLEQGDTYAWKGYAVFSHNDFDSLQTGELSLNVDAATGTVSGFIEIDGETIDLGANAKFFTPGETLPFWNGGTTTPSGQNHFYVETENGNYSFLTAPSNWYIVNGEDVAVFGGTSPRTGDPSDFSTSASPFVAGVITPVSDINALAGSNTIATYSGYGWYQGGTNGYRQNSITVNFGNSTWNGEWNNLNGFTSEGTVTGNQFQSNGLNGRGGNDVKGTFNGSNASHLTGLVDADIRGNRTVGAFINQKRDLR